MACAVLNPSVCFPPLFSLAPQAGNMYAWDTRNWGLVMPRAPLLFTDGKCGVPFTPPPGMQPNFTFKKAYLEKSVRKGEVVDIIFNNLSPYIHPMHLHGNDFLVRLGRR